MTEPLPDSPTQPLNPADAPPDPAVEARRQHVEAQVDAFLYSVGITDIPAITGENGWRYFSLGSASGRAVALALGEQVYLCVEARVMDLPSDYDLLLPLMRQLLEENASQVRLGQFGIGGGAVLATLNLPIGDSWQLDVGQCIHAVIALADAADDRLRSRFEGTSRRRVAPEAAGISPVTPPAPPPVAADVAAQSQAVPPPTGSLFERFGRGGQAAPPEPPPAPAEAPPQGSLFAAFKPKDPA